MVDPPQPSRHPSSLESRFMCPSRTVRPSGLCAPGGPGLFALLHVEQQAVKTEYCGHGSPFHLHSFVFILGPSPQVRELGVTILPKEACYFAST